MKYFNETPVPSETIDSDLDVLLHPARAFASPRAVVDDPLLTLDEKRAILAAWASDACAVEAAPALRRAPRGGQVVSVDEILDALCSLDKRASESGTSWARHQVRRASIEAFRANRLRREPQGAPRLLH